MTNNQFGDRYQVGEALGYGGMSEVHRARDLRLGRDVAIKVLRADLARDPTFQARFQREAQNAASLNHPAIVAVYDTGQTSPETGSLPYIVMEYVDGETLRDIVKRDGPLPERRALEIIADVCAAVDFSHRHGIIHRDVKPANVMLTRTGAVKVMDFGIARAVTDGQATVTATAAVIGTAQYLSPEQARGESVDARSDVYAIGCVLYELLTGTPPFSGDTPVAVAYQHVREEPKPPSTLRRGLSRELDAIVLKALNKNPLNRYQTAADMRADVVRALTGQAVEATPVMNDEQRTEMLHTIPPPSGPTQVAPALLATDDDWDDDDDDARRARRIWGFVGVGLLCLALLIGAIYLTMKITDKAPALPPVVVPKVTDLTLEGATDLLEQYQLEVGEVTERPSDAEVGIVIEQDPSDGVQRPPGSAINLVLSSGAQKVSVPSVLRMDAADAEREITGKGLRYHEEKIFSDEPKGRVASQDPEAGELVDPNTEVTVYISQGNEETVIPSADQLIGVPVTVAEENLADARLQAVRQSKASDLPKDEVIELGDGRQPGDQVPVDTVITLIVSDNSLMTMPDLSNMTPDEAVAALTKPAVGWSGNRDFLNDLPKPEKNQALWGLIIGQMPKAGETVSKDAPVTVTVGQEPTISVPDLSGMTVEQVTKALKAAGWDGQLKIVTENSQTAPPGKEETVIPNSQSPASGDQIKMTDRITIHLYPPAEEPPETTPPTQGPPDDDDDDDGNPFRRPNAPWDGPWPGNGWFDGSGWEWDW